MPEGLEEVAVADGTGVEVQRLEEFAVERRRAQHRGEAFVGECLPQHPEAAPDIVVLGIGTAAIEQPPQPHHAVVLPVERLGTDQASILGDQEEQEPVHQAQELPVEFLRGERRVASGERCIFVAAHCSVLTAGYSRSQIAVLRMGEKAVGEALDAFLDPVPQPLAHPPALFHRVLVVLLEQGILRVLGRARQAASVQEPVEDGEVGEPLLLEDLPEVELDIGLAAHVGAVAQEAEGKPIGDEAPELLAAVQVLLDQGMGREPRPPRGGQASQLLPGAHDVHRWRVLRFPGPMGNGEGEAIHLVGARVVAKLVAQETQERDHPGIARDGSRRVGVRQALQPALEHLPLGAGIREDTGDLVGQASRAFKPEVLRLLSGKIAGEQVLQRVRPE
ncbi:MAG: hypothetical protein K6U89_15295 [Chloroflexi bacterium]|nr:hypothetical protein [Chloroflexota bacterium]